MSGQAQPANAQSSSTAGTPPSHASSQAQSHHGNTVAAWSAVGTIIVGCLVMAFGVGFGSVWLFVVGVVVVAAGVVVGKVLSLAGYGKPRPGADDHGRADH